MEDMDRRSVLGFGLVTAAGIFPFKADAQTTSAGKELAPGVKQIDFGERDSLIPSYKRV